MGFNKGYDFEIYRYKKDFKENDIYKTAKTFENIGINLGYNVNFIKNNDDYIVSIENAFKSENFEKGFNMIFPLKPYFKNSKVISLGFSDCTSYYKDTIIKILREYFKIYPYDIFYPDYEISENELKYTKKDIEKINNNLPQMR